MEPAFWRYTICWW